MCMWFVFPAVAGAATLQPTHRRQLHTGWRSLQRSRQSISTARSANGALDTTVAVAEGRSMRSELAGGETAGASSMAVEPARHWLRTTLPHNPKHNECASQCAPAFTPSSSPRCKSAGVSTVQVSSGLPRRPAAAMKPSDICGVGVGIWNAMHVGGSSLRSLWVVPRHSAQAGHHASSIKKIHQAAPSSNLPTAAPSTHPDGGRQQGKGLQIFRYHARVGVLPVLSGMQAQRISPQQQERTSTQGCWCCACAAAMAAATTCHEQHAHHTSTAGNHPTAPNPP